MGRGNSETHHSAQGILSLRQRMATNYEPVLDAVSDDELVGGIIDGSICPDEVNFDFWDRAMDGGSDVYLNILDEAERNYKITSPTALPLASTDTRVWHSTNGRVHKQTVLLFLVHAEKKSKRLPKHRFVAVRQTEHKDSESSAGKFDSSITSYATLDEAIFWANENHSSFEARDLSGTEVEPENPFLPRELTRISVRRNFQSQG